MNTTDTRTARVRALAGILKGALDLVFAPICVACDGVVPSNATERSVCATCWSRARPLPLPRCPRCWTPLPLTAANVDLACRECPGLRPAVRAVRSAFVLETPVRAIVHALKYRGWYSLANPMARRMAAVEFPRDVETEVRWVIPVPVSPVRMRQRGYNQAAMLARAVSRLRGWECREEVLLRVRSADSQTNLHPTERRANVAGAFQVRAGEEPAIAAEHLLLVDDVWTTGATALACADVLLDAGARAVSVLTFARALPELERLEKRLDSAIHS